MDLPILSSARLTLRPIADADLDGLVALVAAPSVAEWWGPADEEAALRAELRNEGRAFVLEAGGELAGWLGFDDGYNHASLDVVLDAPHQDRGLGSEALRAAIGWLVETGYRRFTIDPAVANSRAIRAYEAVGFRAVGVMRSYEQGPDGSWHDNLLMDLLAEELRGPSAR